MRSRRRRARRVRDRRSAPPLLKERPARKARKKKPARNAVRHARRQHVLTEPRSLLRVCRSQTQSCLSPARNISIPLTPSLAAHLSRHSIPPPLRHAAKTKKAADLSILRLNLRRPETPGCETRTAALRRHAEGRRAEPVSASARFPKEGRLLPKSAFL